MKFFNMFAAADSALMPTVGQTKEPPSEPVKSVAFRLEPISSSEKKEVLDGLDGKKGERDFDEKPTNLYRFIQMKRWSRVFEVLENAPEEAKVWIYRINDDLVSVRWRLLPLHAALILNAPDGVIEALLKAYKPSAMLEDDQGSLPLHIVCKIGSTKKVAEMLLTIYPDAASTKDALGRTPSALLSLFDPSNKAALLDSIKLREEEESESQASLKAFENREDVPKYDSLSSSVEIEVPKEHVSLIVGSKEKSKTANVDLEPSTVRPPSQRKEEREQPESQPEPEPEQMLVKVQEQHKERLIAMKESMDMRQHAEQAGDEIVLRTKLEDVQSDHLSDLQRLKEEAARRFEEARAEEQRLLAARLEEVQAKHEAELWEITMSKTEVEENVEDDGKRESELQKIHAEMDALKKQHEEEVEMVKRTAESQREAARREEREVFEQRLKKFESKHKSIVETIKKESLAEREKARDHELKNFERQVDDIEQRHQQELKQVEERLMLERDNMQEDQRKMFDYKVAEIQKNHNRDLEEFQIRLTVAQESAREERTRVIDEKLNELQQKHLEDLEKMDTKASSEIGELQKTIATLKDDLAQANATSSKQSGMIRRTIEGFESRLDTTSTKAVKKVSLLEQTVDSLETSLHEARKHSLFLEDHVQSLEDQLTARRAKDKEIEARLDKMQRSWLCFELSG